MAQRVLVRLEDDLDGSPAEETVSFGLDGRVYEIDLSTENASRIRDMLAPYVRAARRTANNGKPFRRTTLAPDPAAVRAWAQAREIVLPARGRIPQHVIDSFLAAH